MSIDEDLAKIYPLLSGGALAFSTKALSTLRGTRADDTLEGTTGNERIVGLRGKDTLYGRQGNDLLKGDPGDDVLHGGSGVDILLGSRGDDRSYGGADNDLVADFSGDDQLFGGAGNDILYSGFGLNYMNGGIGNDIIIGGIRADQMYGGDGNDRMSGGGGDDEIHGGKGADKLQGYYDNDTLFGEGGNDILMADGGSDILRGGNGDDVINRYSSLLLKSKFSALDPNFDGHTFIVRPETSSVPGIGRDHTGADRLFGGNGDDKIYVGKDDTATGGAGADTFAFVFTGLLGTSTAKITDFDGTEDKLMIAYTDVLTSAPKVGFRDLGNGDVMLQMVRTDESNNKDLRDIAVIEDGASFGLTAADVTFELLSL